MPIPVFVPLEEWSERQRALRLLPPAVRVAGEGGAILIYPRLLAHFIDLCVVQGFSIASSQVLSALLVTLHRQGDKMTAPAFHEAFDYANGYLMAASFAALALVYFVALPHLVGRTPGLGLVGLRVEGENGALPNVRQLVVRLGGCVLAYASGGMLCLTGLRKRDGRFLHDEISGTRVVKDGYWPVR